MTQLFMAFGICAPAPAETIQLKSGRTINGRIVEQDDEAVRVELDTDIVVTYYRDEIEQITETIAVLEPQPAAVEPSAIAAAQPSGAMAPRAAETAYDTGNFLWLVKTGKTDLYLLGSIHLGKADMYPLSPAIEDAFGRSSVLVVEVNTAQMDPVAVQQQLTAKGLFPDGQGLADSIAPVTLEKLKAHLSKYDLTMEQIASFKPWFLAVSLTMMQIKDLGFQEEYGVDLYFERKAQEQQKRIMELETFTRQLEFLDSIRDQDLFLEYTLESLDQTERLLSQLLTAWRDGDAAMLEKITLTDILREHPEVGPIYQTILFGRNVTMVQKIKELPAAQGPYFVVVGAAHLVGDKGIVELLRKEGYHLQQL